MKNTKFNKHNFWFRILVSPLIFCLILISFIYHSFRRFYFFIKYGGELITFQENERPTIQDIYDILKQNKANL